jgi:putative acetyltransferase
VEHEARRTGARMVELWSDTRFTAAHRLYERLGYIRLPETRSLSDLSQTTEFHYRKQLA